MQPTAIPDGLAEAPPGPELGVLLAGIDLGRVANGDTVTVLQAWRRQRSHGDAAELAVLAEVGRCNPFVPAERLARLEEPDSTCGLEIAAALTLTEVSAWREHGLAEMLVHRLPAVHASLAAGKIDRGRAVVFADLLEPLTDVQNERICAVLVPKAPGLTSGQLRARLRRMVLAIDPDAARRRYERALGRRRLVCVLDEDGTATLTASGLDPTAAQAACERVDGLARVLRAAGHPEPLPAIRADLVTALLDGSLHGLCHDDIVAVMLARATTPDPDPDPDPDAEADTGAEATVGSGAEPAPGADTGPDSGTGHRSGSGSEDGSGSDADTELRPVPTPAPEADSNLGDSDAGGDHRPATSSTGYPVTPDETEPEATPTSMDATTATDATDAETTASGDDSSTATAERAPPDEPPF